MTRKETTQEEPMLKLLILLQLSASMHDDLRRTRRDERGSVTTEHVLWAVAVIAIVGIVVAAVTSYVTTQAGKIK
jgi:Flp pilus assembly pilin Flp